MPRIKCFDVVKAVTDEATSRFAPFFSESDDCKDVLKQYCSVIDMLIDKHDGDAIEVEVDEIQMTIKVTVMFSDLIIEKTDHLFYDLADRAESIQFYVAEEDMLGVSFVFPSIWVHN